MSEEHERRVPLPHLCNRLGKKKKLHAKFLRKKSEGKNKDQEETGRPPIKRAATATDEKRLSGERGRTGCLSAAGSGRTSNSTGAPPETRPRLTEIKHQEISKHLHLAGRERPHVGKEKRRAGEKSPSDQGQLQLSIYTDGRMFTL